MAYTVGSGSGVKRKVYFDCPRCASPVDSTLEFAGQKRPCPICGREMEVPGVAEVKIMRAEEAAKEARRLEEQRVREERAAAAAKARAEREAAEEAAAEKARAERREKRKRSAEKRRAAAAGQAAPAAALATSPASAGAQASAGAMAGAGAGAGAEADPFAGVDFTEAEAATRSSRKPRRRRRFAGFLAGVAALLLGVTATVWWRSERVESRIEWGRRTPDRSVAQAVHSTRGAISYERRTYVRDDARQAPATFPPARIDRPAGSSRLDEAGWTDRRRGLGFGVYSDLSGRREREGRLYHWELIVPYWALCAVLALPVLISLLRRTRRQR